MAKTNETAVPQSDMDALMAQAKAEVMAEMKAAMMGDMKAELMEQLKAEMAAEAAKITTGNHISEEDKAAEDYLNELVEITLFKDGKDYKDDVTVHLNGKNIQIKRGVPVMIPRKFALVLKAGERQDMIAQEYAESQQRDFQNQCRKYDV